MLDLDAVRCDALQETGNIGLGNAVTALSEMTGQRFHVSVPVVKKLELEEVPHLFGDAERVVVGASTQISGDWTGRAAFIFPWASAEILWRRLINEAPATLDDINELHSSTIGEISNIMLGSFLGALSNLTGMPMMPEPPAFVADMSAAVLNTLTVAAISEDCALLAIQTAFRTNDVQFEGYFLFLPQADGFDKLFAALGLA